MNTGKMKSGCVIVFEFDSTVCRSPKAKNQIFNKNSTAVQTIE